jgi:hypothetical protein
MQHSMAQKGAIHLAYHEQFPLWISDEVVARVDAIAPRLASWNANTDPEQMRVQRYLDDIQRRLGVALLGRSNLFLHMDIALNSSVRLLRGNDLENYLYPVLMRLGWGRFVYVTATKYVGNSSSLTIGTAKHRVGANTDQDRWNRHTMNAGSGPTKTAWKANLRQSLISNGVRQLPAGPVDIMMAWRCTASRNWVEVWKPTGDAMGPILGEPNTNKPYSPADDRIVRLAMHRVIDNAMVHDIKVGLWWRSTENEDTRS